MCGVCKWAILGDKGAAASVDQDAFPPRLLRCGTCKILTHVDCMNAWFERESPGLQWRAYEELLSAPSAHPAGSAEWVLDERACPNCVRWTDRIDEILTCRFSEEVGQGIPQATLQHWAHLYDFS